MQAVVAAVAARGVILELAPSGTSLLLSGAAGVIPPEVIDAVEKARPLLVAHLGGPAFPCAWPHDGDAPPATTIDALGNGVCDPAAHEAKPEPKPTTLGRIAQAVGLA